MSSKSETNNNGKLYLIPTLLGESTSDIISETTKEILNKTEIYIVENAKSARHFLKEMGLQPKLPYLTMHELNKRTDPLDMLGFLDAIDEGKNIGLLSEVGAPGIADPGAEIVSLAHEKDIQVVPLAGPSSIMMAIMASGLNGQSFTFNGYLPIEKHQRIKRIKELERLSKQNYTTQMFMETPYRNNDLLKDLVANCSETTMLCLATNITLPGESIKTRSIMDWQGNLPDLNKQPTVFLLLAD